MGRAALLTLGWILVVKPPLERPGPCRRVPLGVCCLMCGRGPGYCHHLLGVRDQPALVQGFQDMLPEVGKLRAGDTILKIEARAGMPNGESFAFFASSLRHRPAWREAPYQARVSGRISPEVRQMDH